MFNCQWNLHINYLYKNIIHSFLNFDSEDLIAPVSKFLI